ncbi:MAG: 5-dehydro-2-deoxygluconokinase [Francisella sp.]
MAIKLDKFKSEKFEYDIICMGRVGVDLYASQIGSPLKDVQTFNKYLGGSPGNISVGSAKLGLKSALFSGVGTDEMGKFLKQELQKHNVDTSMVADFNDYLTALVILGIQPPSTFPLIFYRNDCADMQLQKKHINEEKIKQSKAFLFSGTCISTESMRETTRAALNICKKHGVAVIFDVDYRPVLWGLASKGDGETRYRESSFVSSIYQEFLPYCDLVVGTDEELCIASGCSDPILSIENIQKSSEADVVYKTGLDGSEVHLYSEKEVIKVPAFVVDTFNTLGAGDAYLSGLLSGILKGESWSQALEYANAAGAIVCSRHGCAPAMPNKDELLYFINGYKNKGKDIVNDKELARKHFKTEVGFAKDYPLSLLAFDHRWQFEEVCDQLGIDYSKIAEYKNLVYDGFRKVRKDYVNDKSLGVICDPQYGLQVLNNATKDDVNVLAPIEASKIHPIQWLDSERSLYEIIYTQPKTWGVKVLWKYHKDLDDETKNYQMEMLHQLYQVCFTLERKLMLELIIPDEFELTGKAMKDVIADVYENEIYPFWWKLQMLNTQEDWQEVESEIAKYDSDARIIVLGGNAKNIDDYKNDFAKLSSCKLVNGFAFGRSIFWNLWLDFAKGNISDDEVVENIANRYSQILHLWNNK